MKSSLLLVRITAILALGWACLGYSGCVAVVAGAAAGAGAVAYVRGELSSTLNNSYEAVGRAAGHAVTDLQLADVSNRKDGFDTIIVARTVEDKKVEIRLTKASETTTHVRIRVGVFGDEVKSLAILEKIKANL